MKTDKQMPALSEKNGLYVEEIPPELQLTPLENQCIARNVLFMKIKELPITQMKGMVDRTVLVPINNTRVINTMEFLDMLEDPQKLLTSNFQKIFKKNSKNDSSGTFQFLRGTKS